MSYRPVPDTITNAPPRGTHRGNAMKHHTRRLCAGVAAVIGLVALSQAASAQQKSEFSIPRQPGILYLPTHIIEKQQLIEKQAARLSVPNVTTKWLTFSGGGAQ